MFVNYKNSFKETERLNVAVRLTDPDFLWDGQWSGNEPLPNYIDHSDIVAKLSFRGNKVFLVTPDTSLGMNKQTYLKYINQLSEKMCVEINNNKENKIKQNKKLQENIIKKKMKI